MNIKLEDIKSHKPCVDGWKKLIRSLDGRTEGDVSLSHILDSNGIEDAVWCLRALPYRDQCLFKADVAELAVHLCDDPRPQQAIDAIRQWHKGEINDQELADASRAAAYAAKAAYASRAAVYAAYAASRTARIEFTFCADADDDAWLKITELFKRHYCEDTK